MNSGRHSDHSYRKVKSDYLAAQRALLEACASYDGMSDFLSVVVFASGLTLIRDVDWPHILETFLSNVNGLPDGSFALKTPSDAEADELNSDRTEGERLEREVSHHLDVLG